ncbi:hypothetical protein [Arthrobacter sp. HLT1-21]
MSARTCDNCLEMYAAGYREGIKATEESQEDRAELAASKFYAKEHYQTWLDAFIPATISAMEVERYRREPGSSYIPRDGDPRYPQTVGGGAK